MVAKTRSMRRRSATFARTSAIAGGTTTRSAVSRSRGLGRCISSPPQRILTEAGGAKGALQEPAFDEVPQPTEHRYKIDKNPPARFVAIVPTFHGYDEADPERRQNDQHSPKPARAFVLDSYRIAVEEFKLADGAERDRINEQHGQQHRPIGRPVDPTVEAEQKFPHPHP